MRGAVGQYLTSMGLKRNKNYIFYMWPMLCGGLRFDGSMFRALGAFPDSRLALFHDVQTIKGFQPATCSVQPRFAPGYRL